MTNLKQLFLILLSLPLLASVVTQKIEKGSLSQTQNFNGTLSFNEKSRLAAESDGVITQLYFDEGDYVKKDKVLLSIDNEEYQYRLAQAEANLAEVDSQRLSPRVARLDPPGVAGAC